MGNACSAESIHTDNCIHYSAYAFNKTRRDSRKSNVCSTTKVAAGSNVMGNAQPTRGSAAVQARDVAKHHEFTTTSVAPVTLMRCPSPDEGILDAASYSPAEVTIIAPGTMDAFE